MATAVAAKTLIVLKKSIGKQLAILTTVNTFLLSLWAQSLIHPSSLLFLLNEDGDIKKCPTRGFKTRLHKPA